MSHDATAASPREAILRDIASKLPVRPNARKRQMFIAAMAIGAAAFLYLLLTNPQRAWGAWAINSMFFLGVAMAGPTFSAGIRLTNGRWAGPMQRIAELLAAYIPVGIVTMAVLLAAGAGSYFPWVKHVEPRQAPYLNLPFLWVRTVGGLLLFAWLARRLVMNSLRPDARLLLPHVPPELKADYEKLARDWKGDEEEHRRYESRFAYAAPQVALLFAVLVTVMAWDYFMSLTPNWVSGLFGWWVYASTFLTGLCFTAFLAAKFRSTYRLEPYISHKHFWDTGKLIFSFCIFWVYAFFSQYLPIWYANMHEETWWFFLRLEDPWRPLAVTAFAMIFLVPFLGLMNQTTKSSPMWLSVFAALVVCGVWLERHLLVMPSLHPESVWIGWPEMLVTLGFVGLFGWPIHVWVSKYPVVKVTDVLAHAEGHGH